MSQDKYIIQPSFLTFTYVLQHITFGMCNTNTYLDKLSKYGVAFTYSSKSINRIKKVIHKICVRHTCGRL